MERLEEHHVSLNLYKRIEKITEIYEKQNIRVVTDKNGKAQIDIKDRMKRSYLKTMGNKTRINVISN